MGVFHAFKIGQMEKNPPKRHKFRFTYTKEGNF